MHIERSESRDRTKLAILERIERTTKYTTNRVSVVSGIASILYFSLLCGFLTGQLSVGQNTGFAAMIAVSFVLLMSSPAYFVLEIIEKKLSSQIAEATI